MKWTLTKHASGSVACVEGRKPIARCLVNDELFSIYWWWVDGLQRYGYYLRCQRRINGRLVTQDLGLHERLRDAKAEAERLVDPLLEAIGKERRALVNYCQHAPGAHHFIKGRKIHPDFHPDNPRYKR